MPLNPPRRNLRLPGHDYTAPGAYFVTLHAKGFVAPFGRLVDGGVELTEIGRIVEETWRWLPSQYSYLALDAHCVMPDHFHGILVLLADEARATSGDAPTLAVSAPIRKSLGSLVGAFKTVSTKEVNRFQRTPRAKLWQRDFYDHVVGDAGDLQRIREYIRTNPKTGGTTVP